MPGVMAVRSLVSDPALSMNCWAEFDLEVA